MSTYFLSAPVASPPPVGGTPRPILDTALESLDGLRRIPLDGSTGWTHMPGSYGLDDAPIEAVRQAVPGVAGSAIQDVRTLEREVFIPIFMETLGTDHVAHLRMLDEIRSLVDWRTRQFRIVGMTERGQRQLTVTYLKGLEGSDGVSERGLFWRKIPLVTVATQPFAEARTDRLVEFQQSSGGGAFLGTAGGTDAPWPRALSSSSLIGDGMEVRVASEVPVYPTLELTGPMDSFEGTLSPVVTDSSGTVTTVQSSSAWHVSVPQGVPAGSTLRLVTDPRARSIRMDGNLAAGRVARGSTLRPFFPGLNVLDVSAPGGTEATRIRLSWRELYRSLW